MKYTSYYSNKNDHGSDNPFIESIHESLNEAYCCYCNKRDVSIKQTENEIIPESWHLNGLFDCSPDEIFK